MCLGYLFFFGFSWTFKICVQALLSPGLTGCRLLRRSLQQLPVVHAGGNSFLEAGLSLSITPTCCRADIELVLDPEISLGRRFPKSDPGTPSPTEQYEEISAGEGGIPWSGAGFFLWQMRSMEGHCESPRGAGAQRSPNFFFQGEFMYLF